MARVYFTLKDLVVKAAVFVCCCRFMLSYFEW